MVYSVVMDVHSQFVHIIVSLHCKTNISEIVLQQDIGKLLHISAGHERVITVYSVIGNLKSGLRGRLHRLY